MNVVATWFSTAAGGAELSTTLAVRELSRQPGVTAHQVVLQAPDVMDTSPHEGGASAPTDAVVVKTHARYVDAVRRLLQRPHSVLLSTHRTINSDVLLAAQSGAPAVAVMRGLLIPGKRVLVLDDEGRPVRRDLSRLGWPQLPVARWIGISHASARSLMAAGVPGSKVRCVYNGVDLPPTRASVERGQAVRFVMAARAERWKALHLGIEAWAAVAREAPEARLQVLAAGPQLPELVRMVDRLGLHSRVSFGPWRRDFVTWLAANADCLIHPCPMEGFGRSVVEAAACGVPAIVADTGGPSEIVSHGTSGLHFRAGDAQHLAQRVLDLIRLPPSERAGLSEAAVERAFTWFATSRMGEAYRDICADALKTP